jgi:CHASE2 domain-containing sensor protein
MADTTSAATPAPAPGRPLIRSWRRALGYGFLLWLVPFVVAVALFSIRQSNRPLFESIMPVVLAACTMVALRLYLRRGAAPSLGESLLLGAIWMAISLLFDCPMFSAGPMKMTLVGYMSDIGAAYLLFPVLTVGAGFLLRGR